MGTDVTETTFTCRRVILTWYQTFPIDKLRCKALLQALFIHDSLVAKLPLGASQLPRHVRVDYSAFMKHKGDVDDCSTVTSQRILLLYSIPALFSCGLSLIGTGSRVIDVSAEVEPTPLTCENESQCQKGRLDQERWSSAGHWGADMACLKKRLSIQNKTQRETTATHQLAAH